jgi:hypothetical protein
MTEKIAYFENCCPVWTNAGRGAERLKLRDDHASVGNLIERYKANATQCLGTIRSNVRSFRVVHRTGMTRLRFFLRPMLAQQYISCYGICYGFWLHENAHLCSISLVKAMRTVSSAGRASDS